MSWLDEIPKFDTFIDIGPGYCGSEAWQVAKKRPKVHIIGFEPSPERFDKIQDRFPGDLYSFAIGAKNKQDEFYLLPTYRNKRGKGIVHHPRQKQISSGQTIILQVRTLDFLNVLLGDFGKCFIWADIEGDELNMLIGAKKLLANSVVGLNLEVRKNEKHKNRPDKAKISKFLETHKFKISRVRTICGDHEDIIYLRK